MGKQIGIIADDLTGANDAGVQLAKKGFSSTVIIHHCGDETEAWADALIVDTDSRAMSGQDAYEATYGAASFLKERGYRHIYKKVDSTLRGNIAEELKAVEEVFQPDMVLIAPAFPKMNRVTVRGHHYVNGALITASEFANDPKTPVTDSYIPRLLRADAGREVGLIDAGWLQRPAAELAAWVNDALRSGTSWFVCDSASEEELQALAIRFSGMDKRIVWAGSAGLIEYLPEALRLTPSAGRDLEKACIGQTLVVSGSLSLTTRRQLLHVRDMPGACALEVDPARLVTGDYVAEHYVENMKRQMDKSYFVLYVDSSEPCRAAAQEAGKRIGKSLPEVSEAIARGLGKIARALLEANGGIQGLVLTGGDTAKAVSLELGTGEMQLYAEAEPGLPFGRLLGKERSYWTITKAGGFGHDRSLAAALHYMSNEKRVRV